MYQAMSQNTKTGPAPLLQRHPILVGVTAGFAFVALMGVVGILWWLVQTTFHASRTTGTRVLPDKEPPAVVRVLPRVNPVRLTITLSEPVTAESSTEILAYSIDGAHPITASLEASGTNVVLTLAAPLAFGSTTTLTLSNLQDRAGNVMPRTEVPVRAPVLRAGFLRADFYTNMTWHTVDRLKGDPKFPELYDHTVYRTTSTAPRNFGDNYGLRLWGFFIPPTNGNYTFYVRSDDESEVFLSSDSDPANKSLVASQTGSNRAYDDAHGNPRFSTVAGLRAGQRYFFEALLKEGGGEDYMTVVCKAEGEPAPVHNTSSVTPMPSSWLACYADASFLNEPGEVVPPGAGTARPVGSAQDPGADAQGASGRLAEPPVRTNVGAQASWSQFRGPNGQGILESANPPVQFNASNNLAWSTAIPPGHSSPCIHGQRLFLTTFDNGALATHAYDRATGKRLWQQTAPATRLEKVRPFNSPASPTPAASADHVFVYFGSFGVLCYDHDGTERWRKPLPAPKNQYGTASSPVLCGNAVVLLLDSDDRNSKLLALRPQDGQVHWQTERPQFTANWSTPVLWDQGGPKELVVLGSRRLTAYDPDTGQERWWVDGFSPETIGVPVLGDGLLLVSAANRTGGHTDMYQGIRWEQLLELDQNGDRQLQEAEVPADYRFVLRPEVSDDNPGYADPNSTLKSRFNSIDSDKDKALTEIEWKAFATQWGARFSPSLKAIRPGGRGDSTPSHVAWQLRRGIPEIPSPLCYRGRLYLVRDGGLVQCVRPGTGEVIYEDRVGVPGSYCASPVAAGGRIYLAAHSGTIVVLDGTSDRLQVLARNVLGEKIWATPALAENTIYVRTEKRLQAFSASR